GMGAFLGVARASELPPKFIHLTYKPEGTPRRKIAIVGKGLTFDSGGLNIKGAGSGIEMMKVDMGGAAATLGAAKAIGHIKPDVEVHFISAVTENMISGRAMRPGDILTASNGKTIEVNNTDAEGRLTLADALVFADKLGVDAIIDLATLTGACVIALGDDIAGLWSPQD
ncbi:leucyl aminopeptidase, partial [Microcoleus sp. HI-ES]|nr:leucyl aminopeptidase [Microcoleus sp. HI-ES]